MIEGPERTRNFVIRENRQLKTLLSPVRVQLVSTIAFLGACSVREMAACMGRSQESLQFHVRALERAGLVMRVGARTIRRRSERVYQLPGRSLQVDTKNRTRSYRALLAQVYGAVFRFAHRHMKRMLTKSTHAEGTVLQVAVRMSPGKASAFQKRLRELKREVEASQDPTARDVFVFTMAVSCDHGTRG